MSYTAINGMRSARYPMQGMAGAFLRDVGFRRQQQHFPGMFGMGGCVPCGAIDDMPGSEPTPTEEPKDDKSMTGLQMGGVVLIMGGIAAAIYMMGK